MHTCPSLSRQLASVTPLLTQGPVYIEHIIEICCSQIPASNLASGATQFSHQRPYCPPTGQHRAQSRFNEFRGPFFPTSMKLVPGPRPIKSFRTWTHCLPTLQRQKTGGGCPFRAPRHQESRRGKTEKGQVRRRGTCSGGQQPLLLRQAMATFHIEQRSRIHRAWLLLGNPQPTALGLSPPCAEGGM